MRDELAFLKEVARGDFSGWNDDVNAARGGKINGKVAPTRTDEYAPQEREVVVVRANPVFGRDLNAAFQKR